jgi:GNAT superfamily N-acetyltransferase
MHHTAAYDTARFQLSFDYGCNPADFESDKNIAVASVLHPKRLKYKDYPDPFKVVTFGRGAVIAASGRFLPFAESLAAEYPMDGFRIFSNPCKIKITDVLRHEGYAINEALHLFPSKSAKHHMLDFSQYGISMRIFETNDIRRLLYPLPGFDNALSYSFGERTDVIAACAIRDNRIIAVAGASNDSEMMWQIGIDVLPEFRQLGIGSTLVSILTDEILRAGKTPYYSLLTGNIASLNTALACGFSPVYSQIYVS